MLRRLFPILLLLVIAAAGCREQTEEALWLVNEALDGSEENLAARCADDLDNDEDGLVDCADPDCAEAFRCSERGAEPIDGDATRCFDRIDNDENGYTDCADYSCLKNGYCRTEEKGDENTAERCSDGMDNDWDDKIDCDDVDCMLLEGVDLCEASDAACSDGIDNDKDGYVDCGDWSCSDPEPGVVITVCDPECD